MVQKRRCGQASTQKRKRRKPESEPVKKLEPALHVGIRIFRDSYVACYQCDGKKKYVGASRDYDEILRKLQEDVKQQRALGKRISKDVGEPKSKVKQRRETKLEPARHVGIIIQGNSYYASYQCDGKPKRVGVSRDYDEILRKLQEDVKQQRALGKRISKDVGELKSKVKQPRETKLEPALHVGIRIQQNVRGRRNWSRLCTYEARYKCDRKMKYVGRSRDYDEILRKLQENVKQQRALGKRISKNVGELKPQYPKDDTSKQIKVKKEKNSNGETIPFPGAILSTELEKLRRAPFNIKEFKKLSKNFEKRVFIQVESKRMKGIRNKAAILVGVGHEPIPPKVIERANLFCASGEKYKALVILRWWQYIEKMIKLGKPVQLKPHAYECVEIPEVIDITIEEAARIIIDLTNDDKSYEFIQVKEESADSY